MHPRAAPAVDRGERRAASADAVSGQDVDLDAGFLQRAQHARVVRAVRARAGKHEAVRRSGE